MINFYQLPPIKTCCHLGHLVDQELTVLSIFIHWTGSPSGLVPTPSPFVSRQLTPCKILSFWFSRGTQGCFTLAFSSCSAPDFFFAISHLDHDLPNRPHPSDRPSIRNVRGFCTCLLVLPEACWPKTSLISLSLCASHQVRLSVCHRHCGHGFLNYPVRG